MATQDGINALGRDPLVSANCAVITKAGEISEQRRDKRRDQQQP
jgi:hypothetical protein